MTLGEKAKEYYLDQGLNCAVSVLMGASDTYNLGLKLEDAKLVTAFGGGMGCGNLCGALAGAMAALGKVYLPEGEMYNPQFKDVCSGFVTAFTEKWGTTLCAPIKEANVTPEARCSKTVLETGNMLQEYIDNLIKK
ncbi:MAG: C-GCAxxG-C-C family protein [Oscillospiraceae bacterium]|nr:C-GCAxxG-C-C family protein [Oscillospiraceae bacterium]MBR6609955.1 C-GCAxxG-C-C family protein [Oscillospiraceae bacterium]